MFSPSNPRFLLLGLLLLFGTSACEQQIDIFDPTYDQQLNVYGVLSTDQVPKVVISRTRGHRGWAEQAQDVLFVEGLSPILSSSQKTENLEETAGYLYDSEGFTYYNDNDSLLGSYYLGSTVPQAGETYTLKIPQDGDTLIASTTIPQTVQIDDFRLETRNDTLQGGGIRRENLLVVEFQDQPNMENDYFVEYGYSGLYSDWVLDTLSGEYKEVEVYRAFVDRLYGLTRDYDDGSTLTLASQPNFRIQEEGVDAQGNPIRYTDFWFRLVNQGATLTTYWLATLQQQNSNYDPFAEPVFLPTNVQNGRGILGAKSFSDTLRARFIYHR